MTSKNAISSGQTVFCYTLVLELGLARFDSCAKKRERKKKSAYPFRKVPFEKMKTFVTLNIPSLLKLAETDIAPHHHPHGKR